MRAPAGAALGTLLVLGGVAHAITADEAVHRVQARLDATKDFTAAVDQELVIASAGKTQHATGTVAFKRPGKMRWTLSNGSKQVIVADGTPLWF